MFATISERQMHLVRWLLAIGWIILIVSLFYDPISASLTQVGAVFGSRQPNTCTAFQGQCIPIAPYPMGARIFWGMILPAVIIILFVFGHEAWRRICPLSFISQIPRALGWQRKHLVKENSWLHRYQLYFQFGLLFLGLNIRLLLVNSDRLLLGIFLIFTLLAALTVGFLYGGKTWCNYFCPMAPVQMIYSEPGGLLGSAAHTASPKAITQSMCRTVDRNGQERSACVACKSPCMDIDAEQSYWDGINRGDRKLLYYGYVGLVIGFYLYFGLYSGNWNFLSGGVWNETNQLATLLAPGFYLAGHAIPIPKLVAVPFTLTVTTATTYGLGLWIETRYQRYSKRLKQFHNLEQVHNQLFTIATFLAFNLLFFMGVHPTLGWLPSLMQPLVSWVAVIVSSLWLVKTWQRSIEKYGRERDGNLLRRQLGKLDIDYSRFLEGRSLDQLNPDELYALAKVLPGFSHYYRLQIYSGILKEALERGSVRVANSLKEFASLRQELRIQDSEHSTLVDQLLQTYPDLLRPYQPIASDEERTVRRTPRTPDGETTVVRSAPTVPMGDATQLGRYTSPGRATHVDPTVVRPLGSGKPVHRERRSAKAPDPSLPDLTVVRPWGQEQARFARPANEPTIAHPSVPPIPAVDTTPADENAAIEKTVLSLDPNTIHSHLNPPAPESAKPAPDS